MHTLWRVRRGLWRKALSEGEETSKAAGEEGREGRKRRGEKGRAGIKIDPDS